VIDRDDLRRRIESDKPLDLSPEEAEWLNERRLLRRDPALRLRLDIGHPQEEVRESALGTAIRRAAWLLPLPVSASPAEMYLVWCASKYLVTVDGDR
jgi:hypothetical protein